MLSRAVRSHVNPSDAALIASAPDMWWVIEMALDEVCHLTYDDDGRIEQIESLLTAAVVSVLKAFLSEGGDQTTS
jgi:hypothetical protein